MLSGCSTLNAIYFYETEKASLRNALCLPKTPHYQPLPENASLKEQILFLTEAIKTLGIDKHDEYIDKKVPSIGTALPCKN